MPGDAIVEENNRLFVWSTRKHVALPDTKHLTELLISSSDAGGLSKVCSACS